MYDEVECAHDLSFFFLYLMLMRRKAVDLSILNLYAATLLNLSFLEVSGQILGISNV